MFFIQRGIVDVFITKEVFIKKDLADPGQFEYDEEPIGILTPGKYFGEIGLITK